MQHTRPCLSPCCCGKNTPASQWRFLPHPTCRLPALLAGWSVAAYSLPAHKEFRFLLPALQLLMPYCGLAAASLLGSSSSSSKGSSSQRQASGAAAGARGGAPVAVRVGLRSSTAWQRWGAVACLLLQLPMAAYFVLVHQG